MKCWKCQAELAETDQFCPFCGEKQPKQPISGPGGRICPNCGKPLGTNERFCQSCGFDTMPQPNQKATPPGAQIPQQPKGKGHIVALVCILVAVLLCVAVVLGIRHLFMAEIDAMPKEDVFAEDWAIEESPSAEKALDIADVDADIVADGVCELTGTVKTATNGMRFLKWDEPLSILVPDSTGEMVLLEDVTSAYLVQDTVDDAVFRSLENNQTVLARANLMYEDSALYLYVQELLQANGSAIIVEQDAEDSYILPDSNKRLLTSADVENLSLQQINYAKNEIYARHGRMFQSKELQDYFNTKTWYHGTVAAGNFSESVLSEVERKNASYLAELEFSIAPNGYQLDQ